jgi:vitamin B12 transporter
MNNIARTGHEGIEVSWQQTIFGAARLGASYNYTDAVNRDTGVQLKRRPRNQATLTLGTQLGFWNCTLAGRWGEKRLDTDPVTYGTITAPGRTIVDLAITRATGAVQPYLTIRNLLNKGYEEIAGYRAEGRGIEAGIRSVWQ